MTDHAFENLLRTPVEFLVAIAAFCAGRLILTWRTSVALDVGSSHYFAGAFFLLSAIRFYQGFKVVRYHRRLLSLKPIRVDLTDVPHSKKNLFLGKGFKWLPIHRQRLHLLSLPENQCFIQKNWLYRLIDDNANENPKGFCSALQSIPFLPFKPSSDIGGKPWIHGVGTGRERKMFIRQINRSSHIVVFGMTRVGKTCLMNLLVNQDIRNKEAVLVIDPKGDLSVLQNMYAACKAAGRLDDFKILHAGFPDLSAKYNPLSNYSNVSEVATRITNAIEAHGEGKQFKDFAWKFLNITASCLAEIGEPITYKTLAFFVNRPRQLLLSYCDKVFSKTDPQYVQETQKILDAYNNRLDAFGNDSGKAITRIDAVQNYLSKYIDAAISDGRYNELNDSIISDLHYAAQLGEEYYSKITASLGPVFDKINKTAAGSIFSWEDSTSPVIQLEEAIREKQVIYIGLDAMTNQVMSDAIGQAIISDLISLCGRLYKESVDNNRTLYLHADEFSEIVRDEFVTLLNKAGGAGVRVTAYTQTVNDLGAAFRSQNQKPKMLLGNFGSTVMMRIANRDTASILTDCLETIRTRNSLPSTIANDHSGNSSDDLFSTHNSDSIAESQSQLITENDLFSLPKGQAFVVTNGGEILKIRIPLLNNDETLPQNFESLIQTVNSPKISPEKSQFNPKPIQASRKIDDQPSIKSKLTDTDENIGETFISWLSEKITGKNIDYHINAGKFIFAGSLEFGTKTIFISEALFHKYCEFRDISLETLKKSLAEMNLLNEKKYQTEHAGKRLLLTRLDGFSFEKEILSSSTIEEIINDGN